MQVNELHAWDAQKRRRADVIRAARTSNRRTRTGPTSTSGYSRGSTATPGTEKGPLPIPLSHLLLSLRVCFLSLFVLCVLFLYSLCWWSSRYTVPIPPLHELAYPLGLSPCPSSRAPRTASSPTRRLPRYSKR